MADARRHAPATQRNRDPICAVLRDVLPDAGIVLEIASGSGEHAVHFGAAFPHLTFQPSDPDATHRDSITAWIAHSGCSNVRTPLALDVCCRGWERDVAVTGTVAAILCINMIHIAPWEAALGLLAGAQRLLAHGAPLYLYGPYRRNGRHTAPSNAAFDASLRAQNPDWGVRDLDAVLCAAVECGFALDTVAEMPANNLSVILRRQDDRVPDPRAVLTRAGAAPAP